MLCSAKAVEARGSGALHHGRGSMAAIYWGYVGANDSHYPNHSYAVSIGTGNGPWVMADLKGGLFGGISKESWFTTIVATGIDSSATTMGTAPVLVAILLGVFLLNIPILPM